MTLPIKLSLAPMAGVTDRAFRQLAREYGATMTFTEMISIKGLYYNDKKTAELLDNSNLEHPLSVQIFGHEPEIFGEVIDKALAYGGDFLDINCGCPAKKIISNGDGSALMKTPDLIEKIVYSVAEKSPVPVSVKMRLGWDEDCINATQCAKAAIRGGAAFITVHGRTTKQGYSGKADIDEIKKVIDAIDVPVIANGDIKSFQGAVDMFEKTGCAGVMVGRAALGNLYLFKQLSTYLESGVIIPDQTAEEKIDLAKRHIELIVKYKGEKLGIKEARKHALWYVKGMRGNVKYKDMLVHCKTYEEMAQLFDKLKEEQ